MNNFNRLGNENKRYVFNKNFLNNQNYVISDMKKYEYYKNYISNVHFFLNVISVYLFTIFLAYKTAGIEISLVYSFGLFFIIGFFLLYQYINRITKNKIKIGIFKIFNSDKEINYYIFRKNVGGDTSKYFIKSKKIKK